MAPIDLHYSSGKLPFLSTAIILIHCYDGYTAGDARGVVSATATEVVALHFFTQSTVAGTGPVTLGSTAPP